MLEGTYMKLTAIVLAACLLAFNSVPTPAQAIAPRTGEAFQVRKNILITDMTGARFSDQNIEDLKLFEDGTEQKITALSSNRGQLHLVIVIDDSGSMISQKDNVAAVGKFVVQNLEPSAQVQIVRFPSIRVVNEWTSDRSVLLKLFDEAPRASGSSPIYDGVWTALDQIKDANTLRDENRAAIVLISDCMEGGSLHRRDELLDELNKRGVPLFTVMLTEQFDRFLSSAPTPRIEQLMKHFERFPHDSALASGGSAYFPRKGDNAKLPLSETLKDLTAELWSQFVLTYTPTNQTRDGKERNLRIGVADSLDNITRAVRIKETYVGAQSR
jgi:VWFA-related protein